MLWLILLLFLVCGLAAYIVLNGWFGAFVGDLVKKGFEKWDGL